MCPSSFVLFHEFLIFFSLINNGSGIDDDSWERDSQLKMLIRKRAIGKTN